MAVDTELSERELDILKLVATGASNKEIAQQLVISPNTVKVHLRNIFSKIGVASRTEATLYAIRIGLIPTQSVQEASNGLEENSIEVDPKTGTTLENLFDRVQKHPIRSLTVAMGVIIVLVFLGVFLAGEFFQPEVASPQSTVQRWAAAANLPVPCPEIAAERYERSIVVICFSPENDLQADVFSYSADRDQWVTKTPKPTLVSGFQAVVVAERLYVPGGMLPDGRVSDQMEVYDPREDIWTTAAPLPEPRSEYALAAFEGRLYLFGGWDGKEYSGEVFVYDPITDQWDTRKPMPEAFGEAAAAVIGNKIYVIGGKDNRGSLNSVWAYYPNRELNGEKAWEARTDLPDGRVGAGLVSLADGLYLVGGTAQTSLAETLRFNETNDIWEMADHAPQPIGNNPGVVAMDTKIHVLGGSVDGIASNSHQTYQVIFTVLLPAISK